MFSKCFYSEPWAFLVEEFYNGYDVIISPCTMIFSNQITFSLVPALYDIVKVRRQARRNDRFCIQHLETFSVPSGVCPLEVLESCVADCFDKLQWQPLFGDLWNWAFSRIRYRLLRKANKPSVCWKTLAVSSIHNSPLAPAISQPLYLSSLKLNLHSFFLLREKK